MIIDCANDTQLAFELGNYLKNNGFDVRMEESSVITKEGNLDEIIRSFLKEQELLGYNIRKIDSETLLLSKEVSIEDFGFLRCEMCGYIVSNEEELLVHRRAHGIQLL